MLTMDEYRRVVERIDKANALPAGELFKFMDKYDELVSMAEETERERRMFPYRLIRDATVREIVYRLVSDFNAVSVSGEHTSSVDTARADLFALLSYVDYDRAVELLGYDPAEIDDGYRVVG